jgi:hypothetical protein
MPDPSMIALMKAAAHNAGVDLDESFNQIIDLNLEGHGRCTGLAAVWLDQLERGEGDSFLGAIKHASNEPAPPLREKVEEWQAGQHAEKKPWFQEGGLMETEKKHSYEMKASIAYADYRELDDHYQVPVDPATGNKPEIKEPTARFPVTHNFGDMVDWINKTTGKRRFFLIETLQSGTHAGHTMAAAKNRKGLIRFFDPNGGVVSAWMASKMKAFMGDYFSTRKVFWAYSKRGSKILQLDVSKYVPTSWGPGDRK